MGLVRRKTTETASAEQSQDFQSLMATLVKGDARDRRNAARDLVKFPEAAETLCESFGDEDDPAVQHAILTTLIKMNSDEVVKGMIPYLRSENAGVRNAAVEALQQMPEPVSEHIKELLTDGDSDVRIFAIDVLQALCHEDAPAWLGELIQTEPHVNVCATAVDRLAEIGTPEMIPALRHLAARFPDEFFMTFAVQTAIDCIEGTHTNN